MITIRRLRCAAAMIGLVVGVSVALNLPQRVLAQTRIADGTAGSSGTMAGAGIGASSAPLTGSRLHAGPRGEAAAVPRSGPVAVSRSGPAIHVEMAQTAHSGRKPVGSIPPATMAFKPATTKPLPKAATEDVAAQRPAAEQAAEPSRFQGTMPAPAVVEPVLSQEAVVARLPDRTAGDMAAGGATPRNATEEDGPEGIVTEQEANAGDQHAALPPAPTPARAIAQLAFAPKTATLSSEAKGMLKNLAGRFPAHDENARLQLMAYASGEGMSASKARRLSLARALSVREYLIANGIDGTRMDVRALGNEPPKSPGGLPAGSPANRVDIAMTRR